MTPATHVNALRNLLLPWVDTNAGCLAPVTRQADWIDVRSVDWLTSVDVLRMGGAHYFDFLTAYVHNDDLDIVLHAATPDFTDHIVVRTHLVGLSLPSITSIFPGAKWAERELSEMFGLEISGHPNPGNLLLANEFHGSPLRKDFPLSARLEQPWPGEVEPGGTRARRKSLPPGVWPTWITESVGRHGD